jgi:uncharacterized membrane protein HdeD (DUF308 family)
MAEQTPAAIVRHASTWSIAWGVLLIVLGILALGSPFLAAVAVNVVIAWLTCSRAPRTWSSPFAPIERAA